jgi:D-alanyl-D-alanine dipeptidase
MKRLKKIILTSSILGVLFACAAEKKTESLDNVLIAELDEILSDSSLTEKESTLEQQLIDQGLVNLEEYIPGIKVELKYSTTDNFFAQDVYGELTNAYLQPEVADMLKKAQEKLKSEYPNLTLLIYDAVRPLSVQQVLWDNLDRPDSIKPLYVADPKIGSLHNFGVAVDLTILDTEHGEPLDLGTGYDFFGYEAYPDREMEMMAAGKLSRQQVANREILRAGMNSSGFTGIGSEWWHFNAYSRKEAGEKFEIIN